MYANALEGVDAFAECEVPTFAHLEPRRRLSVGSAGADSERYMAAPWRYQRIDKGSHWVMLDNPEPVTRSIIDWLTAEDCDHERCAHRTARRTCWI